MVEIKKWVTHKDAKQLKGDLPQGEWLFELGGVNNDISVLVLSKKVKLSHKIQPICLPSFGSFRQENNTDGFPYVSGWGSTKLINTTNGIMSWASSDVPKRVQLSLITESQCRRSMNQLNCKYCDKDSMLCAYGLNKYNATVMEDSCQGDSGGNLNEHNKKCSVRT